MTVGWHPPLINIGREWKAHRWELFYGGISQHFEVPLHAKVKIGWLAACNSFIGFIVFLVFFGYSVMVEKTYLRKVTVDGVARVQMRHPVKDDCLTLDLDSSCKTDFQNLTSLDYCSAERTEQRACHNNTCPCRYLDEYDIVKESDAEQRHLFMPTRYTKFQHDIRCFDDCKKRYDIKWEDTHFVADIESFTLRVDHTFVARDLHMEMGAANCMGFARFCYKDSHAGFEEGDCGTMHIAGSGGQLLPTDKEALIDIFEEAELPFPKRNSTTTLLEIWNEDPAVRTDVRGDRIKLGTVLHMLGIKLDGDDAQGGKGWGGKESLRRLGFVLVIDIKYYNWKEWTLPNSLPPVYVMSFNVLSNNEYKVTSTSYIDEKSRIVNDAHGILISVKQGGNIGKHDIRSMLMIFVEVSVLIGLGKFFVLCIGVNLCFEDTQHAERFEDGIHPPVEADVEGLSLRMLALAANEDTTDTDTDANSMSSGPTHPK